MGRIEEVRCIRNNIRAQGIRERGGLALRLKLRMTVSYCVSGFSYYSVTESLPALLSTGSAVLSVLSDVGISNENTKPPFGLF